MAEDKVTPFNPDTIMDGVKAKIRAEFVNLIPEEAWAQMVKAEVDRYFAPPRDGNNSYSHTPKVYSPFSHLVQQELEIVAKARFKSYISGPEFTTIWDNHGQPIASEAVRKMIIESSGAVLANLIGGQITMAISNIR